MGYQGASYDSRSLEDAEQLKISAAQLFPNHPAHDRLQDELRKIELAKVESLWSYVRYYQRKRKPDAVAIYCRTILAEYPNSDYAARARKVLNELEAKGAIAASAKADATGADTRADEPPARVRLTEPKALPKTSRSKDDAPGWVDLGV
jgi:hypothetical protein